MYSSNDELSETKEAACSVRNENEWSQDSGVNPSSSGGECYLRGAAAVRDKSTSRKVGRSRCAGIEIRQGEDKANTMQIKLVHKHGRTGQCMNKVEVPSTYLHS